MAGIEGIEGGIGKAPMQAIPGAEASGGPYIGSPDVQAPTAVPVEVPTTYVTVPRTRMQPVTSGLGMEKNEVNVWIGPSETPPETTEALNRLDPDGALDARERTLIEETRRKVAETLGTVTVDDLVDAVTATAGKVQGDAASPMDDLTKLRVVAAVTPTQLATMWRIDHKGMSLREVGDATGTHYTNAAQSIRRARASVTRAIVGETMPGAMRRTEAEKADVRTRVEGLMASGVTKRADIIAAIGTDQTSAVDHAMSQVREGQEPRSVRVAARREALTTAILHGKPLTVAQIAEEYDMTETAVYSDLGRVFDGIIATRIAPLDKEGLLQERDRLAKIEGDAKARRISLHEAVETLEHDLARARSRGEIKVVEQKTRALSRKRAALQKREQDVSFRVMRKVLDAVWDRIDQLK